MWIALILAAMLLVAFANGANDNFKGVATLYGSQTASYRCALIYAAATTFAGSLTAFFFAAKLVKTFSGKGLVPDRLTTDSHFLAACALGAGLTVLLAAMTGIPISTTHSLTGALTGSGLVALTGEIAWGGLVGNFFLPLVLSPLIAVILTAALYSIFRFLRTWLGVREKACLCVADQDLDVKTSANHSIALAATETVVVGDAESCAEGGSRRWLLRLESQAVLDRLHFLTAGAVGFSRGLNDTPKIVALSLAGGAAGLEANVVLAASAMAIGGLFMARRVAETVSWRITKMNHGEGFVANLVTSLLVLFASKIGAPVSTTHVSCGSLFGLGLVSGRADWKVIAGIVGAWVLTLPTSALLAALAYWFLEFLPTSL